MAKACEVLGKIELFEEYSELAEEIRKAIIFEYYAGSRQVMAETVVSVFVVKNIFLTVVLMVAMAVMVEMSTC